MKVINLYNVMLQFDTEGKADREDVLRCVEIINLSLQREPYGLGAQVFVDFENLDFEVADRFEDDDEDEFNDNDTFLEEEYENSEIED